MLENKQNARLAVALLCYNNRDLLEKFLPGVVETTAQNPEVEIHVIDNASTDGTGDYLASYGDKIKVITIDVNRGFTNGYKLGLAQIDAEIYCLLSSDVEVSHKWIEPVLDLFANDAEVAIVQPKIKSWHRKDEFEYAGACGGYMDYQGYPFCRGRIFYEVEKDHGQYDNNEEIFWASGACFFIRAEHYQNSGGLDDDFYAHMEEIDLCWRIKNQGYKVMACPASEVYHLGGAVIAYGSPQKVFRNHRNNLIMMVKNLPGSSVLWLIILRLLMDGLAFANMIMRGQARSSLSIITAHWSFFYSLPRWLKKRREIQVNIQKHTTTGIYRKSIVYQYFVKGRTRFSDLEIKP